MPQLSEHTSGKYTKLMYIGTSGTGKTGSLTSLVKAGYKLRILDLDNGVEVLKNFIMKECPEKISLVDYESCRDKYKAGPLGPVIKGSPKAYVEATKLMTKWSDESIPAEWGKDTIFVLDSLSSLGRAALAWATGMNPTARDGRQWYNTAQQSLETILALLTDEAFHANVIVISHVTLQEMPDSSVKGFASAIGKALGPNIPKYFNTLIQAETKGSGTATKHIIRTVPTGLIDLKSPAPFKLDATLPLGTGLATIFEKLKG